MSNCCSEKLPSSCIALEKKTRKLANFGWLIVIPNQMDTNGAAWGIRQEKREHEIQKLSTC
jgi:hypothetical protein